jgi:arginine deiminase
MSVRAEWHKLREAALHRPGVEMFMGLLEPYSFLYDRFFSMNEAVFEHRGLEHALVKAGVSVKRLKPAFMDVVDKSKDSRHTVVKQVLKTVRYLGSSAQSGKAYLQRVVEGMDSETLFNILLLSPTVETRAKKAGSKEQRLIYPYVTLEVPLANLYYLRDQQSVTDLGVVYGRMAKPQRRREVFITKLTFEGLGHRTAWSVRAPATFEGGDFIPAGDFALIGIGDRTNRAGVEQILRHAVGYDEVVLVDRPIHPLIRGNGYDPMLYMHLDTYFNIAGEGLAIGCGALLDNTIIQLYSKMGKGLYRLDERQSGVSLSEYLRQKKFGVIRLTSFEQLALAPNFLTVDDRKILAVDIERNIKSTLSKIERFRLSDPEKFGAFCDHAMYEYNKLRAARDFFPRKKEIEDWGVEVVPMDLNALTGGYGAARCMVAALRRG